MNITPDFSRPRAERIDTAAAATGITLTHPKTVTDARDKLTGARELVSTFSLTPEGGDLAADLAAAAPADWPALIDTAGLKYARREAVRAAVRAGLLDGCQRAVDTAVDAAADDYLTQFAAALDEAEAALTDNITRVPDTDTDRAIADGYGAELTAVVRAAQTLAVIAAVHPAPQGLRPITVMLAPGHQAGQPRRDPHGMLDKSDPQTVEALEAIAAAERGDLLRVARGEWPSVTVSVPRTVAEYNQRVTQWHAITGPAERATVASKSTWWPTPA